MLTSKLTQLTCKTLNFSFAVETTFLKCCSFFKCENCNQQPNNLLKCVFLNTYLKKRI